MFSKDDQVLDIDDPGKIVHSTSVKCNIIILDHVESSGCLILLDASGDPVPRDLGFPALGQEHG